MEIFITSGDLSFVTDLNFNHSANKTGNPFLGAFVRIDRKGRFEFQKLLREGSDNDFSRIAL